MKRALAIGAVIAAFAAAVFLRAPSELDTAPALRGATDDAPATPNSEPDASPAGSAGAEAVATNPPATSEVHPAIPANEPRSDAIVPPVKRAKPKDPVLAGDPVEEPKKAPKKPAKPEPANAAKP